MNEPTEPTEPSLTIPNPFPGEDHADLLLADISTFVVVGKGVVITERLPTQGTVPPNFNFYIADISVKVAQTPHGDRTGTHRISITGATTRSEAIAALPDLIEQASKKIKAEYRKQQSERQQPPPPQLMRALQFPRMGGNNQNPPGIILG